MSDLRSGPVRKIAAALWVLAMLTPTMTNASELARWFDDELTPWVVEQVSTHPRFKGEPIRVTVFDGNDEAATPDLLSFGLASRLEERLSRVPAVRLAWRPSPDASGNAGRSGRPNCRVSDERYLIVVEASHFGGSGAQVRVRALDLDDRSWVAALSRIWQGRLSGNELQQLKATGARPELRGSRALPYGADEQDLLAARAARRIACELLEHPAQRPALWPMPSEGNEDPVLLAPLVSRELERFGVVTIVPTRGEADLLLSVEQTGSGSGSNQVWVSVTPRAMGEDLPSARVSLYATADKARNRPVVDAPDGTVPRSLSLHIVAACTAGKSCSSDRRYQTAHERRFRLQVRGHGLQRVDVLVLRPDGSMSRLDSAGCAGENDTEQSGLWLPTTARGSAPAIFAVGAATPEAARALVRETSRVPAECSGGRLRGAGLRDWLADFRRRLGRHGEQIIWRSARPGEPGHELMAADNR